MVSAQSLVPRANCLGSRPGQGGALCCVQCWLRHLTLTVPLSTQMYKWVLTNCLANLPNCTVVICNGLASLPGGTEILLAGSCYRNRDKL